MVIIGLQADASAPDLTAGGVLLQVWAAARRPDGGVDVFSSLVRVGMGRWATCPVDDVGVWNHFQFLNDDAAERHGFTQQQIADAPAADDVDQQLLPWLPGYFTGDTFVAGGFDVAHLPFLTAALPRSMSWISTRSIDVNSCCALLDGWDPDPQATTPRNRWVWQKTVRQEARRQLADTGISASPDAGYRAAEALVAVEFLRRQLDVPHGAGS